MAEKLTRRDARDGRTGGHLEVERGVANPRFDTLRAVALAVRYEIDINPRARRR